MRGLEREVGFGKCLVPYEFSGDGTVKAILKTVAMRGDDVLVGTDGTGSTVRKQWLPDARVENTGMASFWGKLPASPEIWTLLTPAMLQNVSMIQAPGPDWFSMG
ncbi:hypothetical protein [Acidithiobacillus sp.]|uniref:hypothetical protein n=1 Tax=Acidithiobacillus sp. TaxID=1872118 RepID=UPI00230C1BA7|nr:hypothetical protein [Acidithiobacillus sp.]MDA8246106.1 hypothetical protein [Acidithiobacillus sp.]